jgi:RHS repeat-associated protein
MFIRKCCTRAVADVIHRARYYDPSNGRFNQRDSFEGSNFDPQSVHKYSYCHGDPINASDPSGYLDTIQILGVAGVIGILGAITGATLAAQAGKSKVRGVLAGAALGAGVGIALAAMRLPYAFAEGFCGATLVAIIDLAYEHFFEPDGADFTANLRFDMFETFCWGLLDASLDNPKAMILHDSTKTYALNLAQAFVNFFTSREDYGGRMKDLLKEIGYALAAYCVNASLDMVTQGLSVKVPPWLMKELGPKIEKLAVHGAEKVVEWASSRLQDVFPAVLKDVTEKTKD